MRLGAAAQGHSRRAFIKAHIHGKHRIAIQRFIRSDQHIILSARHPDALVAAAHCSDIEFVVVNLNFFYVGPFVHSEKVYQRGFVEIVAAVPVDDQFNIWVIL